MDRMSHNDDSVDDLVESCNILDLDDGDNVKGILIDSIGRLLTNYDYPANWIVKGKTFEKDAATVYAQLCATLHELHELDSLEQPIEGKNSSLTIIGIKYAQLYLGIHLGEFDKVEQYVIETEELIEKCRKNFDERYLPGVLYPMGGLAALVVQLRHEEFSVVRAKEVRSLLLGSVDRLDTFGKVGLMAIHATFIGETQSRSYKEQEALIREMIVLDPTCAEWKLRLYNVSRFRRREGWTTSPSPEERSLILEAASLAPDNPKIIVALCDTIAEVLKEIGPDWTGVQDFGYGRKFASSLEIAVYLRNACLEALALDPTSVRTNMTVCQIFSVVIPKKFRDQALAKRCIDRALQFHPSSSRTNHRLGIYYLMQQKNPTEAIKHFERAVQFDARNFPAVGDLIQTYFSDIEPNEERIKELFKMEFENENLSEFNVGRLHFMQGIFLFMQGQTRRAIEAWITAFNKSCELEYFGRMRYLSKRYSWPNDFADTVEAELRQAADTGPVQDTATLRRILSSMGTDDHEYSHSIASSGLTIYEVVTVNRDGIFRSTMSNRRGGRAEHRPNSAHGYSQPDFAQRGSMSYKNTKCRRPSKKDIGEHYQTLGIKFGSSVDEINKAYTKLCYKYLPDRSGCLVGSDKNTRLAQMSEINAAYAALMENHFP